MKAYFFDTACRLLIPLAFVVLALLGQPTALAQPQSKSKASTAKGELQGTLKQFRKAFAERDFEFVFANSTQQAQDDYVADLLWMCIEIADAGDPAISGQFEKLCKQVGISSKLIPGKLLRMEDISMDEYESLSEKAYEALLSAVGEGPKRVAAVQSIMKAGEEAAANLGYAPMNPFAGEMVELTVDKKVATIELDSEVEPSFQRFVKAKAGWQWDGIDEDKLMEWYDQPLPLIENITLKGKSAKGQQVDLADYKGKVVLVDFWGTWCGPCVGEMPELKKIYAAFQPHGFEILGVAVDDADTLKEFVTKRKIPWQNIIDGESRIANKYRVNAFPTKLLIDTAGKHYASDIAGIDLVYELIGKLELEAEEFESLIEELGGSVEEAREVDSGKPVERRDNGMLPVGFGAADANHDDKVSQAELDRYLSERLPDELPVAKIFARLDSDKNDTLSESEFELRHDAIGHFMGPGYLSGGEEPEDPGSDYVPFRGSNAPLDDRKIFGAIYHRYYDTIEREANWPTVELEQVPENSALKIASAAKKANLEDLYKATLMVAGGGSEFFAAGAVVIREDGLAVTNYHVAEAMQSSKLFALTHDGKSCPIVEFLAGNRDRDIALIRVAGEGFTAVPVAENAPSAGADLTMIHHSENRFYTYDRGYVMRYPVIGSYPWMEVSMDYAPGGSGCGIFNAQNELVGLVSTIQFGDGPSIAEPFTEMGSDWSSESTSEDGYAEGEEGEEEYYGEFQDEALIMVKHSVSLNSIQSLFKQFAQ